MVRRSGNLIFAEASRPGRQRDLRAPIAAIDEAAARRSRGSHDRARGHSCFHFAALVRMIYHSLTLFLMKTIIKSGRVITAVDDDSDDIVIERGTATTIVVKRAEEIGVEMLTGSYSIVTLLFQVVAH